MSLCHAVDEQPTAIQPQRINRRSPHPLTRKRWELLEAMIAQGPMTIREAV
jgi:hypothetical protein